MPEAAAGAPIVYLSSQAFMGKGGGRALNRHDRSAAKVAAKRLFRIFWHTQYRRSLLGWGVGDKVTKFVEVTLVIKVTVDDEYSGSDHANDIISTAKRTFASADVKALTIDISNGDGPSPAGMKRRA